MPGIGVITNPKSKANKRDPASMYRLGTLLGTKGSAEATKSLDDLSRAAEEFKAADIDLLGINGGDGTIHVVLTTFLRVYGDTPLPKVAILRGGTLNTVAAGLRITGTPESILHYCVDGHARGINFPTVERPVMRFTDQSGDRFGFIFGNGLIANFLEAYYASGKPSPTTGALLVARTALSAMVRGPLIRRMFRRVVAHVRVDGEAWARTDFATLTCATVPELGIGFAPYARCWESTAHFALLGIHCSPLGVVLSLPAIYRGRPMRRDRAISTLAQDVTIMTDDEVPYTIDGDLHRAKGEIRIRTGPVLRLVVPDWSSWTSPP
jgi:diacylglycerol kinase family enzyme